MVFTLILVYFHSIFIQCQSFFNFKKVSLNKTEDFTKCDAIWKCDVPKEVSKFTLTIYSNKFCKITQVKNSTRCKESVSTDEKKYIIFHQTFYVSNEIKVNEIKLQKLKLKIKYIENVVVFVVQRLSSI